MGALKALYSSFDLPYYIVSEDRKEWAAVNVKERQHNLELLMLGEVIKEEF